MREAKKDEKKNKNCGRILISFEIERKWGGRRMRRICKERMELLCSDKIFFPMGREVIWWLGLFLFKTKRDFFFLLPSR